MSGSDDLIGLYWTTSGPVEVHFGREWSLFSFRERCEQAAAGRVQGHRALACRHRAPPRDTDARRAAGRSSTSTGSTSWSSSSWATGSSTRTTSAGGAADKTASAALRGGGRAACAPHQGRQHHGHGMRAAADRRGIRRALRRRRPLHGREDRLRVHAVRRPGERRRDGVGGRRGSGRAERRPRIRHVAPRQDAARTGGAPPHTAPLHLLGRALRRPVRVRGGPPRRGHQSPPAARRGRVPHRRVRRRLPRARVRRPLGRRGAVGRAPQPPHRADLRPSLRDDERAARRCHEKGASVSENGLRRNG